MKEPNTIFSTLWARVIEQLNKGGPVAWDQRLSQIIAETTLPPLFPFKKLPNVKEFRITFLQPHNPILLEADIRKRLGDAEKESTPYKNKSMNRYVEHQFRRLNANRHNPSKFWSIATHLLFRSHSYRVICFNHVYPQWHRKYKYSVVKNILLSLKDLDVMRYDHKIRHIPKPNGELRPLGIPSPAWRILLHGLNNILLLWLSPYIHSQQHGFYPGRGTLTAWQDLSKLLTSTHIYEFDLRKFFDSVNLMYLSKVLKLTGIPERICDLILLWNQTLPRRSPRHGITWRNPLEEANDYKYSITGYPLNGHGDYEYWMNAKRQAEHRDPSIRNYEYYRGVSQGMPISPLLSTLILAPHLVKPNENIVMYADDGIITSNFHAISPPIFPKETGICLNESKSSHVKTHGTWLTSLKFLGLRYEYAPQATSDSTVNGGTLTAATRIPGSSQTPDQSFTLDKLDLMRKAGYYLSYEGSINQTYDHWLDQKLAGYLLSRLYNGGYDESTILQDFTMSYTPNSWTSMELRRKSQCEDITKFRISSELSPSDLTIFNSSSYANQSLSRWMKCRCPFGRTW